MHGCYLCKFHARRGRRRASTNRPWRAWTGCGHKIAPPKRGFGHAVERCRIAVAGDCPLLQQAQHVLRNRLGLGQHRGTGLLQDLRAGQFGGGLGIVGIGDPAA